MVWKRTKWQLKTAFTHQSRGYIRRVQPFFTTVVLSAWAMPCPFVYHLPPAYIQSNCSHPGCLNILKNSIWSLCGTWREGCGSSENKECVFSADRCPVQGTTGTELLGLMYGFQHRLHTSFRMFIAVWQASSSWMNNITSSWPLQSL